LVCFHVCKKLSNLFFCDFRSGTLYNFLCLSVHRCICVKKKNQLHATEWFIALIICSTCFGHFYAHHQELETICVLLPPMVCSAWLLVVRGQEQGNRLCVRYEGCCTTQSCNIPHSERIACYSASDL